MKEKVLCIFSTRSYVTIFERDPISRHLDSTELPAGAGIDHDFPTGCCNETAPLTSSPTGLKAVQLKFTVKLCIADAHADTCIVGGVVQMRRGVALARLLSL